MHKPFNHERILEICRILSEESHFVNVEGNFEYQNSLVNELKEIYNEIGAELYNEAEKSFAQLN